MRTIHLFAAAACLGLLAGCGGENDDATAEVIENDAERAANVLDAQADVLEDAGREIAAEAQEAKADAIEDVGEAVADAVDDADIHTQSPAAAAQAIEQQTGLPTSPVTAAKARQGQ